jgi:hypothetical protein
VECGAHSRLQIEVLRIDAKRGESGKDPARGPADGCSEHASQPDFCVGHVHGSYFCGTGLACEPLRRYGDVSFAIEAGAQALIAAKSMSHQCDLFHTSVMRVVNPKSLVAAGMVLLLPLRTALVQLPFQAGAPHDFNMTVPTIAAGFWHKFTLIAAPVMAAFCLWHSFNGKRQLVGDSEFQASLILGGLSVSLAAGAVYAVLMPRSVLQPQPAWPGVLVAALYLMGATFYFWNALRERRQNESETIT